MMEKKNILLADCEAEEVAAFAEQLHLSAQPFAIMSHIANWKRTGKGSELKRYAKYFGVGFLYFLKRGNYHAIVGWQQFYALIFCFFCSLFHVKKRNFVVALNFTYKPKGGLLEKPYRWFMGKCVCPDYLDYLHVPSEEYADSFGRDFGFPRERIIVAPFGVDDRYEAFSAMAAPLGFEKDGYALAIGRSNRDYDFLIRAWRGVDYPLVIISDTYRGNAEDENIRILTDVAGEASYPWIANCGLMIIPIDDETICSGDTVLLTAMSVGRKVLITAPSALAQMYITDGDNALLTEKNEEQFRLRVSEALFSEKHRDLGKRARDSFLRNYSRGSMGKEIARQLESQGKR